MNASARRAACAVCMALVALAAGCSRGRPPQRLENLLVVLLDTTRADHLSCYGYPEQTTKQLDSMGLTGVRFEAAYAQSSLTPV